MKKKIEPKKNNKVYIYHDLDHGNCGVFSTLKKAKEHAEAEWPDPYGEEGLENYKMQWEDCGDGDWSWGEYARVWTRTIDEESK